MRDSFRNKKVIQDVIDELCAIVTLNLPDGNLDLKFNFFDEVDQDLWCVRVKSKKKRPK